MDTAVAPPLRPASVSVDDGGHALELVRRVRGWPFVRVEERGALVAVRSGVRDERIARLDLLTRTLTVYARPDRKQALLAQEPLLHPVAGGVRLDVGDEAAQRAAERALRWRVDMERYLSQMRHASP
jgi:hypothetical protein